MAFSQAAMAAFADYTVANCNGRTRDLAGNDLNVDGRYGYQCMDLWIWARYRLGFRDNLPTPDAAAVWEMNWTDPNSRMWDVFDGITPDQPAMPGDFFVMNRGFFGNGVGHIGMVLADLGGSIRVLELNGLGDGYEDDNGGQHGSPARIQDWPKTYLYGYLRWVGPAPSVSGQSGDITPIITPKEDTLSAAEVQAINTFTQAIIQAERKTIVEEIRAAADRVGDRVGKEVYSGKVFAQASDNFTGDRILVEARANVAALLEALKQATAGSGAVLDLEKIQAAAQTGAEKALAEGLVKVQISIDQPAPTEATK